MIGWIYFIASCYIVTFIAKSITKGINSLIKQLLRAYAKLRQPNPAPSTSEIKEAQEIPTNPEVVQNVH